MNCSKVPIRLQPSPTITHTPSKLAATISRYGLNEVHSCDDAEVDIVFLHGLRGSIDGTWSKNNVCWPQDLLPQDIPKSRIYLFGYDSGIIHRDPASMTKTEIHSDADDLSAKLETARSNTNTPPDRPIIFVAHSLGGLVAAQILVHGNQSHEGSVAHTIGKNLRGLIFLGTPFRGSKAARPADVVRKILELFGVETQQDTLELLGVDSKPLTELTRAFANVLNKRRSSKQTSDAIDAYFFYETKPTKTVLGRTQMIVEPDSAQLPGCGDPIPIAASHLEICKFETNKDEGYELVVATIRKIMVPSVGGSDKGTINTITILGKAVNVSNKEVIINGGQTNTL